MSELESLHSSLEAMGFQELALASTAVAGYAVALNGLFSARSRAYAALLALAAGAGFAASMSQWIEGVMLMALMVAAMGIFVGIVWTLSVLCGLTQRPAVELVEATTLPPPLVADPVEHERAIGLRSSGSHAHSG